MEIHSVTIGMVPTENRAELISSGSSGHDNPHRGSKQRRFPLHELKTPHLEPLDTELGQTKV